MNNNLFIFNFNMKIFLKRILHFIFILIIGIISFTFLITIIVKFNSDFSLNTNDKNLILGHSHPECAFNDNLIANFRNLSKSGEAYIYTYYKLKEVTSQNKIDAVFIEFSNNVIQKARNQSIYSFISMNNVLHNHLPFMEKSDIIFLFNKNKIGFIKTIPKYLKKSFLKVISFNYSISKHFGGYLKLEKSLSKKMKNDFSKNQGIDVNEDISIDNIRYLRKLVDYCKKNTIKVFFIRSPQHNYSPQFNETKLLEIKSTYFKEIEFFDFNNFPLNDDEYANFGHLNYKGAEKFSNWFNNLIRKDFNFQDDKENFVKNEIKKLINNANYIQNQKRLDEY